MNDYAEICPEYDTWLERTEQECLWCLNLDESALPVIKCQLANREAKRKALAESEAKGQVKL